MGSKERIQRLKDETRANILEAALQIVKEEGWQALSMRKIADIIEYTAPMIYEYFENKDAILNELAKQGHLLLAKRVQLAKEKNQEHSKQLQAMWLAYWDFSFEERELYQLMFGIGTACCEGNKLEKIRPSFADIISEVIREVMAPQNPSQETICQKYFTYWAVIHGLISINIVDKGDGEITNQRILQDAIQGITHSLYS